MDINEAMIDLYSKATNLAQVNKQLIGEKHDYYVTLEQLMALAMKY